MLTNDTAGNRIKSTRFLQKIWSYDKWCCKSVRNSDLCWMSGTGWFASGFYVVYIWQFSVSTYPFIWKWVSSVHKFSSAIHCPLPCEQEILKQESVLLADEQEGISAHGLFCIVNSAECFIEFYTPCSQICPMFGQFSVHCPVGHHYSTSPALLLFTSSNDVKSISFPPSIRSHIKRICL